MKSSMLKNVVLAVAVMSSSAAVAAPAAAPILAKTWAETVATYSGYNYVSSTTAGKWVAANPYYTLAGALTTAAVVYAVYACTAKSKTVKAPAAK